MIKTIALLLVISSLGFAASANDSILTEASRTLKKTKNLTSAEVTALRRIEAAKDTTVLQMYFAAHLIASSEVCTNKSQGPCPEMEFLFKNRIEAGKLLGKKAAYGAARVRGDYYLEKGKFDAAIESFEFLTWAPGGQHEYAILKLGWAYLNKKEANKAFALWTLDLKSVLKNGQAPSHNMIVGLGQAFSENLGRSSQDVASLNALKLNQDDKEALVEGLLDGLYFLSTPDLKARWATDAKSLSIFPTLAKLMLVDRVNTLLPNCDFLPLLTDEKVFATIPASKDLRTVLAQCLALYKKNGDKALLSSLATIVDRSDLKDSDPFFAFNFYDDVAKQNDQACAVGSYWAFHEMSSQKVALKEIAAACRASGPAPVLEQLATLGQADKHGALLRSESSPVVLTALLLDQDSFHAKVAAMVKAEPQVYKGTLLPTMLAEQLGTQKKWTEVAALKQSLGLANDPGKKSIWTASTKALLIEKIQKKDFGGTIVLMEELKVLTNLDEANLSLVLEWARTFYETEQAQVGTVLNRVAASLTIPPKANQLQVLVQLLLTYRSDKEVTLVLEHFGIPAAFQMPPSFDAQLFDRTLEKTVTVNLNKVKSPHYRKLINLAQSLSRRAKLSAVDFEIKGKSPLHDEFALVKKVYTKSAASKKEKLGSLDKVARWVDYLQTVSAISKKKWISYHLLNQAVAQGQDTLGYISANLGKLEVNQDITPEEWEKIVSTLRQKVTDAQSLLNDLATKAKSTLEKQAQ